MFSFRLTLFFDCSASGVAHIIKEVDISEELYSQQLIYRWRSNPEPREKLNLITFLSLWFFKTPAYNDWNILKEPKCFYLHMF